jgi:hypothetical protein
MPVFGGDGVHQELFAVGFEPLSAKSRNVKVRPQEAQVSPPLIFYKQTL